MRTYSWELINTTTIRNENLFLSRMTHSNKNVVTIMQVAPIGGRTFKRIFVRAKNDRSALDIAERFASFSNSSLDSNSFKKVDVRLPAHKWKWNWASMLLSKEYEEEIPINEDPSIIPTNKPVENDEIINVESRNWGRIQEMIPGTVLITVFTPTSKKRNQWNTSVWSASKNDGDSVQQIDRISSSVFHVSLVDIAVNYKKYDGKSSSFLFLSFASFCYSIFAIATQKNSFFIIAIILSIALLALSIKFFFAIPIFITKFWKDGLPRQLHRLTNGKSINGIAKRQGILFNTDTEGMLPWMLDPLRLNIPSIQGVRLAYDNAANPVRIPDADRYQNIIIVGGSGTGKTTGMLNLLGGDLARIREQEIDGFFSRRNGFCWIETKKGGTEKIDELSRRAGVDVFKVSVKSDEEKTLRFLPFEDPLRESLLMVEALKAAYGDSIQERSNDILRAVFVISMFVFPHHLYSIGDVNRPNFFRTAYIIAGGAGWEKADDLIKLLEDVVTHEDFKASLEIYRTYISKAARDKEKVLEAPRNKLTALKEMAIFDTSTARQTKVTWKEVLNNHVPLVLDFTDENIPDEILRLLIPMSLYTLWDEAKKNCAGWDKEKKSFAFYCDEISTLSEYTGNLLSSIADKGRSHGLELVLGTQRWSQINKNVKDALVGFGQQIYLGTNNPDAAIEIARYFADEIEYNAILNLKPYHGICIFHFRGVRYSPQKIYIEDIDNWRPEGSWLA